VDPYPRTLACSEQQVSHQRSVQEIQDAFSPLYKLASEVLCEEEVVSGYLGESLISQNAADVFVLNYKPGNAAVKELHLGYRIVGSQLGIFQCWLII
jgi:hypothetical protein